MQSVFGSRLSRHAASARGPAVATLEHEIPYAELLDRVRRRAAWLERERFRSGEVVGVTIADELPHFVTTLALLWLGIPQVCLPTYEPAWKRLDLARRLDVGRVILADSRHALPGLEPLPLSAEPSAARANGAFPDAITSDPDAPGIYYASSGTTGEPKLYALSQRALAWRGDRIIESERTGARYRALSPVSIEDPLAKNRRVFCACSGQTSLFIPGESSPPLSLLEVCARLDATHLELSILQVSSLLADQGDPQRMPAGIAVYTTGAMVAPRLRSEFEARFGLPLLVHYGAREFGRISANVPGSDDCDAETVGRPVPWIDLEIVDDEPRALPPGEIGEIRVRSEHMTPEYHRDPLATSRHFRDGWFYPGDLGSLTRSGALCVHGRVDDMMNLNGIKIFPAEIERVLEEHPAVRAAAAFPKSSAAHGDIPVAAVELHDAATVAVDELMARARERLGVRAPRKIVVLPFLPRNAAGKIVKRELESLIATSP
jgi:acyl-coenzyme A synthetase/AMP-(fatty) acid ligase